MAKTYQVKQHNVVGVTATPVQLMPANGNRVSFLVSSPAFPASASNVLILYLDGVGTAYLAYLGVPINQNFPYRDYGPIVKSEIWCGFTLGGPFDVSVVEIIAVP